MKGNDALMSCGKYPAGMTLVEMVSTIDIYIEREYVYILCCCWLFWDYVFNDVGWLDYIYIYIFVIYITFLFRSHSLMVYIQKFFVGYSRFDKLWEGSHGNAVCRRGECSSSIYLYREYIYIYFLFLWIWCDKWIWYDGVRVVWWELVAFKGYMYVLCI